MRRALHVRAVKMNSENRRTTPSFRHIALSHHRLISGSISFAKFRSELLPTEITSLRRNGI